MAHDRNGRMNGRMDEQMIRHTNRRMARDTDGWIETVGHDTNEPKQYQGKKLVIKWTTKVQLKIS